MEVYSLTSKSRLSGVEVGELVTHARFTDIVKKRNNFCDFTLVTYTAKKGKRRVQGVPQSQTTVLPRRQEEEETDKTKQAQIEQTYEKQ